jgi:hypothetical protein
VLIEAQYPGRQQNDAEVQSAISKGSPVCVLLSIVSGILAAKLRRDYKTEIIKQKSRRIFNRVKKLLNPCQYCASKQNPGDISCAATKHGTANAPRRNLPAPL